MEFKELLENMLIEIKKISNKTNDLEEMKAKLDTMENKLNSQNSRLLKFFDKIDELKQVNLESATLLEEIAFCLLEDNREQQINHKEKEVSTIQPKEKYIN